MRIVPRIVAVVGVAALCGACGDVGPWASGTDWGPLAVIDGGQNLEDALVGGVLAIDEDCVAVGVPGHDEVTTLAWPSEATTWNDDDSTITYETGAGDVVLSDGDEVSFGGGFKDADADVDADVEWIVEPRDSCGTGGAFYVGGYSEGFSTGD